mmetsp:Transcript_33016/g.83273  ORF Transcript_33016/g.83273 Transcript_33016/m.83273 type:complete len:347 (+) Transcript_33016:690-1730(+)
MLGHDRQARLLESIVHYVKLEFLHRQRQLRLRRLVAAPLMIDRIFDAEALREVRFHQLTHQILGVVRYRLPARLIEGPIVDGYVVEQRLLVVVVSPKRGVPAKQDVQVASEAPCVRHHRVINPPVVEAIQDLGRHVRRGAAHGLLGAAAGVHQNLGQPEVRELGHGACLVTRQHEVLWLEISMRHAHVVKVGEARGELHEGLAPVLLAVSPVVDYAVEQGTARDKLHYEQHPLGLVEPLLKAHAVLLVHAAQDVDLRLQRVVSWVDLALFDYFNRPLFPIRLASHEAHLPERTLAQDRPDLVQVLEVSLVQLHMAERSTPAGHVLRAHGTTPRWLLRLRLRGWGLR